MRRCLYLLGAGLLGLMPFMSISSSAEVLSKVQYQANVLASSDNDSDAGESDEDLTDDGSSNDSSSEDIPSDSDYGNDGDDGSSSDDGGTPDYGSESY